MDVSREEVLRRKTRGKGRKRQQKETGDNVTSCNAQIHIIKGGTGGLNKIGESGQISRIEPTGIKGYGGQEKKSSGGGPRLQEEGLMFGKASQG